MLRTLVFVLPERLRWPWRDGDGCTTRCPQRRLLRLLGRCRSLYHCHNCNWDFRCPPCRHFQCHHPYLRHIERKRWCPLRDKTRQRLRFYQVIVKTYFFPSLRWMEAREFPCWQLCSVGIVLGGEAKIVAIRQKGCQLTDTKLSRCVPSRKLQNIECLRSEKTFRG